MQVVAQRFRGQPKFIVSQVEGCLAPVEANVRFETLRRAISTSTVCPETLAESFRQRFALPLAQGYGIIEAGLPAVGLDTAEQFPGAVGRTVPGYDVEIRRGEVWVRGPGMFDGYVSPARDALAAQGIAHDQS